jgi:hypothetical protein
VIFCPSLLDKQKFWQIFENEEHIVKFPMEQNTEAEQFLENQKSEFLNHESYLNTKFHVLLESVFTQDDQIMKSKLGKEVSLRKVHEIQKVNIRTSQNPKY